MQSTIANLKMIPRRINISPVAHGPVIYPAIWQGRLIIAGWVTASALIVANFAIPIFMYALMPEYRRTSLAWLSLNGIFVLNRILTPS